MGVPDGMDSGDMGKKRILNSCSSTNKPSYFRFGLRGNEDSAVSLLKEFPMEARTKDIATAQIAAVNAILSNIPNGNKLVIRNFNKLKKEERGFSRQIFLAVLNHFCGLNLITRKGNGYSRSKITYSPRIMRYIPDKIFYHCWRINQINSGDL